MNGNRFIAERNLTWAACKAGWFDSTETLIRSAGYYGWYFFRGPPAFDAQMFITGRGRRKSHPRPVSFGL